MAKGIRIWRYQARTKEWRYRSRDRNESTLAANNVATGVRTLEDGDWLFEETANRPVPGQLTQAHILSVVPGKNIPPDGNVWWYSGSTLQRILNRTTNAANDRTAPAHIQAAGIDCDQNDLLVDQGTNKPPIHISRSSQSEVDLETVEGSIEGEPVNNQGIDESQALSAIVQFLEQRKNTIGKQVFAAGKAMEDNDPSTFMAASQALLEAVAGATPGPTQGTNVAHQFNEAAENISKVVFAIQDSQKAVDDAAGVQGDFAAGVGSVDASWQAIASVLSMMTDAFKVGALIAEYQDTTGERCKDIKKLLIGRSASLAGSSLKSYATIMSSIGQISSIASGASILSATAATSVPVVGSVVGLAACARSSWQAEKSRKRSAKLWSVYKQAHKDNVEISDTTQALLSFAMGKAIRRTNFKAGEAIVSAGSASAGICLAVGASLAGANAWNPVGWGLGAAVVVAGGGLLTYKVCRKLRSKNRARKRGFSSKDFPKQLITSYMSAWKNDSKSMDTIVLSLVIDSYAVDCQFLHTGRAQERSDLATKIQNAIFRIERHIR